MAEIALKKPVLITFYGFPGSGKSYIAKNLEQLVDAALVSSSKIHAELFPDPRNDEHEAQITKYVMDYMAEEFLKASVSVIYDTNLPRISQRRNLRSLAGKYKAEFMLVWLQIDPESAFTRTQNRDKRRGENRYAVHQTQRNFDNQLADMQNPKDEQYIVTSGKHSFITQKSAILNRLYQMGLIDSMVVQSNVAKPGLINLVPSTYAGRVDLSRRNITID